MVFASQRPMRHINSEPKILAVLRQSWLGDWCGPLSLRSLARFWDAINPVLRGTCALARSQDQEAIGRFERGGLVIRHPKDGRPPLDISQHVAGSHLQIS